MVESSNMPAGSGRAVVFNMIGTRSGVGGMVEKQHLEGRRFGRLVLMLVLMVHV